MKFIRSKFISLFIIFSVSLLLSCEINDPQEGLEVRLNSIARETMVSAFVYDANTRQPVTDNVKITFLGNNASKIVDETNDPTTTFETNNSVFNFGIKDGTALSPESPLRVSVRFEAEGYFTETTSLSIIESGNQSKYFFIASPSTLPDNSEHTTFKKGSADASGAIDQSISHTTEKGTNLAIEEGTVLTDADGNPLSGELTYTITSIPITGGNKYNASEDMITSNNQIIEPILKPSFKVTDENGRVAINSSKEMKLTVPLPDEVTSDFQPGDKIPVWIQDFETGYWEKLAEVDIVDLSNSTIKGNNNIINNFIMGVVMALPPLPYFENEDSDLDGWQDPDAVSIAQSKPFFNCTGTINIKNYPDEPINIQIFDEFGNFIKQSENSKIVFLDGLNNSTIRVNADLWDPFNTGIELGSNISVDCNKTKDLQLDFSALKDLNSIRLDIEGICTASSITTVVKPNITLSYKKESSSTWRNSSLVNGQAIISALEAGTYEVRAQYQEYQGTGKFQFSEDGSITILDVDIPENNIISSKINNSTTPPTIYYELDLEDTCL